jgi:adenylate kinase
MAVIGDMVGLRKFKPDIDTLILDGIPRNVTQAEIMRDILDVRKVFHLSCPDQEALIHRLKKRALKENRLDDANEETIRRRLVTYEEESKPVLNFYGPSKVLTLDATQAPVKVTHDILSAIIGTME